MNNAYLKDIITYESAYQGVITPKTKTNFYSLCKKVFEKASDGGPGYAGEWRVETYRMIDFNYADFRDFFGNPITENNLDEIVDMLNGNGGAEFGVRYLEVTFIGDAYNITHSSTESADMYNTQKIPCHFSLTLSNDSGVQSITAELTPIIQGQTIDSDSMVVGDLILKAYGHAKEQEH